MIMTDLHDWMVKEKTLIHDVYTSSHTLLLSLPLFLSPGSARRTSEIASRFPYNINNSKSIRSAMQWHSEKVYEKRRKILSIVTDARIKFKTVYDLQH